MNHFLLVVSYSFDDGSAAADSALISVANRVIPNETEMVSIFKKHMLDNVPFTGIEEDSFIIRHVRGLPDGYNLQGEYEKESVYFEANFERINREKINRKDTTEDLSFMFQSFSISV